MYKKICDIIAKIVAKGYEVIVGFILCAGLLGTGFYGLYKYTSKVWQLLQHDALWYRDESFTNLLISVPMLFFGVVLVCHYYDLWRGMNVSTVAKINRYFDLIIPVIFIAAGICTLFYFGDRYRLLNPKQVPRTTVTDFKPERQDGALLDVTGRFDYEQIWRTKLLKKKGWSEDEEGRVYYYYQFYDMKSDKRIFVGTHLEPLAMIKRFGVREQKVRGVWHEFSPEEQKNTYIDPYTYLRMQADGHELLDQLQAANKAGVEYKPHKNRLSMTFSSRGMPFPGALNMASEVDDPTVTSWLLVVGGCIVGIPLIIFGVWWLKPFFARLRRS